jgi:4-amino-4-deoxy-L-arabinose transferase-like glycosyltransferase
MSSIPAPLRHRRLLSVLFPAALVLLALFMGFYNLGGDLMNDDEGTYLYSSWRVSLGDVPYRDFFVSQAPASFYLGAAVFKIFGATVPAARALSFLFILGTACLIIRASRKFFHFSADLAFLAAAVFLFTKHIYFLGRMFMPDNAMLFFSTAALYFALKSEAGDGLNNRLPAAFFFGAFAGLATLAKLNAVLLLGGYLSFLLYLWLRSHDKKGVGHQFRRKASAAIAGFLLAFGLIYALFVIFVPGTYHATLGFHLAKEKILFSRYAALPFVRLAQFIGNHDYGLIPLAIAGLFASPVFKDKKRTLLFFMTLAVLVQVLIPGTFFLRYIVFAFVPLAFFFGDGVAGIGSRKKLKYYLFPVAAVLILLSLGPAFNLKKLRAFDQDTRALAAFVGDNTSAGDYVFGDDPGINFLARRPCPPRLVDVSGAMTRSGQITAVDIRNECESHNVKLILVETSGPAHHLKNLIDYPAFQAYLDEDFTFVRNMPREFLGVDIYRRK